MHLALRNLFRHRRRALLAFSAVAFGVVALLLAGGFIEWVYAANRQAAIESRLGHIQITRPGYFERGFAEPFDYLLPAQDPMVENLRRFSEVAMITPRLAFGGLISFGTHTVSFLGEGVMPRSEVLVSGQLRIIRGGQLESADDNGVILGEGLADSLGAKVGDRVVLLATKSNGGFNALEVIVRGVFQTASKSFDDYALRAPLPLVQRLLEVNGVHTWVVLLKDTAQTDSVLSRLQARFSREETGPIEFTPWYKLAEFYNKTVALFSRQMNVLRAMIAVIVVLSIANTMIAGVLERTGEVGTLLAFGYRRRRILGLFLSEGLLQGVVGGMLGIAVGWAAAQAISIIGIPMPPAPGMAFGFDAKILLTPALVIGDFLLILATTLTASIYPAWRASRLPIVDALRRNRG